METKKSIKADLEKKRGFFFQIGMLLALSAVLVAFQWKREVKNGIMLTGGDDVPVIDEILPTKPREPEMKKPVINNVPIFNIVDDFKDIDDFELFNPEDDPSKALVPVDLSFFIPEDKEEIVEVPFYIVERMPEFPGGEAARLEFIKKHIVYPELAREIGIEGKVYIGFIVEKDGSITDLRLLKGIGGGCDEEAMRVAAMMPKWIPGSQRDKTVRVKMSMPIHFKLMN